MGASRAQGACSRPKRLHFVLSYKRLARGRFHLSVVRERSGACVQMDGAELSLLLEGIELAGATRYKRYRRDGDADYNHNST